MAKTFQVQQTKKQSLYDAMEEEPERFVIGAFNENSDISNFGEFKQALANYLKVPHGEYKEEDIIKLFESDEVKERIKNNVSSEELDKLYGDGNVVQREAVGNKEVVITFKKIKVSGYTPRTGITRKAYVKGNTKWKKPELNFIKVHKAKGETPKQIQQKFNRQFSKNARTYSSVKSKVYRS